MPIATPQGTLEFKSVDKVTFVGASSNTVIDTTTGSLGVGVGVGGPTSNLHVVGNTRLEGDINMLHTANTASIKLNSNVVTEFPRSKKLIKYPRVAMTQNDESGTSGYVTNASSWENQVNNETYGPWNNFNGILNDSAWQSYPRRFSQTTGDWDGTTTAPYAISLVGGTTIYGEWVELKIPNKIQLHTCRISPLTSTTYPNLGKHRSPRNGYILGRVGATGNWTILKSWSDVIHGWEDLVLRDFDIENPSEYYDYFRVVWTAINGNNNYSTSAGAGYASSGEIEFLGIPEYDPDAHGTDVVVKSIPNVPSTDWLEVYYDAKDLADGPLSTASGDITGLGGTTNNGTAYGNPQISDGAFVFDGNGDYIETTLGSYISGDWTNTVSFWIAWNAIPTSGAQTPFMIGQPNTSTNGIGVDFNSNGNMVYFTTSGDTVMIDNVFDLITPGKWIHFTFIHTPSKKYVYWDGKQVGIWASGGAATLPTSPTLSIGRRGSSPTNYTNAKMANFRLFNRALTSDEIHQLYAYQKEYFGHGDLSMTFKAGRLGIGTSEPRADLDVRGNILANSYRNAPVAFRSYVITATSSATASLMSMSDILTQTVVIPDEIDISTTTQIFITWNHFGEVAGPSYSENTMFDITVTPSGGSATRLGSTQVSNRGYGITTWADNYNADESSTPHTAVISGKYSYTGTTRTLTVKLVAMSTYSEGATIYTNRTVGDSDNSFFERAISTLACTFYK